jgi:hypothetical protein
LCSSGLTWKRPSKNCTIGSSRGRSLLGAANNWCWSLSVSPTWRKSQKELDIQIDLKPRLRCALRLSVLADAAMKNSGPSDFICAIFYFTITYETQGGRVYHILLWLCQILEFASFKNESSSLAWLNWSINCAPWFGLIKFTSKGQNTGS